jgi:hypothetical protein
VGLQKVKTFLKYINKLFRRPKKVVNKVNTVRTSFFSSLAALAQRNTILKQQA